MAKKVPRICRELNSSNIKEFLGSIDYILTDCDGVLWEGNIPIRNASETLNKLRDMGKKVYFVTNNSTKSCKEFLAKFKKLNFTANLDEVFCTAGVAADYLKNLHFNKKVYVMGSLGIKQELDLVGIASTGYGPDIMQTDLVTWLTNNGVELEPEVGAVLVAFDDQISYPKILKACSYLKNPECLFIATNTDDCYPSSNDKIILPGAGSILAPVKIASHREPVVLGKPYPHIFNNIVKRHNIDVSRAVMIGDRLNTDILLGTNCGIKTLLVLSGISTLEEVRAFESSSDQEDHKLIPNYYMKDIGVLLDLINKIA